mmetsp:Transcript_29837/g.72759  ORF Transcript_29837/g.72759 Transcript_29837/m.72759 type:complete len:236 (-) Transcript_29837:672-1379(-)
MVGQKARLPPKAREVLVNWFNAHLDHPYPNWSEKENLQRLTGLTARQIFNWFTNRRKRDPKWCSKRLKKGGMPKVRRRIRNETSSPSPVSNQRAGQLVKPSSVPSLGPRPSASPRYARLAFEEDDGREAARLLLKFSHAVKSEHEIKRHPVRSHGLVVRVNQPSPSKLSRRRESMTPASSKLQSHVSAKNHPRNRVKLEQELQFGKKNGPSFLSNMPSDLFSFENHRGQEILAEN